MAIDETRRSDEDFPPDFIEKLVAHVVAYAEMLYAWGTGPATSATAESSATNDPFNIYQC